MSTRTCNVCGITKPITRYDTNPNRKGGRGPGRALRCRTCKKAARRRRAGIIPRAERQTCRPPARTRKQELKQLQMMLGRLLAGRCVEVGVERKTAEFRARYRNDAAFREREIVRRWAKKAAERGYPDDGTLTTAVLCRLFAEAKGCHYCTRPMRSQDKTLDHVVPRIRDGIHGVSNVVIACRPCNQRKHTMGAEEFVSRYISKSLGPSPTFSCTGPRRARHSTSYESLRS